jgi:uncharacterized membrane protein
MLEIISYISAVIVLAVYFTKGGSAFDKANAILCVPVALPAILSGVWASAAISLTFGVIGAYRWLSSTH